MFPGRFGSTDGADSDPRTELAEQACEANGDASRTTDETTRDSCACLVLSGEGQSVDASAESMACDPAMHAEARSAEITFSPPEGAYDAPFLLELKYSIPESVIHYSIDGSAPDSASPRYAGTRIWIDRSVTVAARARVNGHFRPDFVRAQYTLRAGAVEFSTASGAYHPPLTVALSTPTDGAAIFYTLDGGEPTSAAMRYDSAEPLLLRKTTTVRALAYKQFWQPSATSTAVYELKPPQWLELEPVERDDAVPHVATGMHVRADDWTILAASVRGKLHAHRALWREDAYAFETEGQWTILAVSDGAGSAPFSRVGARVACDRAVQHLSRMLKPYHMQEHEAAPQPVQSDLVILRDLLAGAALQAKNAIAVEAATRNRPASDFAATLLVAVHCPWRTYDFSAAIQIGDGAIALWQQDDGASLLGVADHGEHSSETKFLTTKGIENELASRVLFALKERLRGIAVMTDGVSDDFFPENRRIAELFAGRAIAGLTHSDESPVDGLAHTVLKAGNPDEALCEWLKYAKRGSSDDRTVVLFFRR